MRVLVTGKEGQVVQALLQRGQETGVEILTIGRPEMDMANPAQTLEAIRTAIAVHQPNLIVNTAAYTAVDQAEDEPELAFAVNGASAGAIAQAAAEADLPIIQISTDYVFDGTKDTPYVETDAPNPQGVYGASKLAGEEAVRDANAKHLIFRTAWVYSPFGKNFAKTMLKLAETRDELRVVADQIGNPTSAFEIADGILAAARRHQAGPATMPWGTYHLVGPEAMSWAEFAIRILAESAAKGGPTARVVPITTAEYPTKAKRPANSRLDRNAMELAIGLRVKESLISLTETMTILLPLQVHAISPVTSPKKRTCIMVLGMHRSGTSAITGTLVKLGVAGPNNPYMHGPDNLRGHWESLPIIAFHDRLLAAAGSHWSDVKPFNEGWLKTPTAEPFYEEARNLMMQEFSDYPLFVFKDPRVCRYFPFWNRVMQESCIELKVVLPLRNPLEVAKSLAARDNLGIERGLLLWLDHMIQAEYYSRDSLRSILSYNNLLSGWRNRIKILNHELNENFPVFNRSISASVDSFLTTDMRNQFVDDASWNHDNQIHRWASEVYRIMQIPLANAKQSNFFSPLDTIKFSLREYLSNCELNSISPIDTNSESDTNNGL